LKRTQHFATFLFLSPAWQPVIAFYADPEYSGGKYVGKVES